MKTYMPLAVACLCVLTGCSTPEAPADTIPPASSLVPSDYTVLGVMEAGLGASTFNTDDSGMEASGPGAMLPGTEQPSLFYRTGGEMSFFMGGLPCGTRAGLYRAGNGTVSTLSVMDGLDPCLNEVVALAHSGTSVFLALRSLEGDGKPDYLVRRIPWEGGTPSDLPLDHLPVDLEIIGGRLFVLTLDETGSGSNRLEVFGSGDYQPAGGMDLDTDARMLGRVGGGGLLVSYPSLHLILEAGTLGLRETVRYQDGVHPGFCLQEPLSDPQGNWLYYPFEVTSGPWSGKSIPALYDIGRRTAILYYFSNFLDPVQLETEFDIGTASSVGYDAVNEVLLVGYSKGTDPSKGGILRIQTQPELRFLDQADLPAAPLAIFSDY